MGTIALSAAVSSSLSSAFSSASLSAFSAAISSAFTASPSAASLYSRAIPSLRASHPLAANTGRQRSRRYGHGVAVSPQAAGNAPAVPVSRLRVLRAFEPGAHPAAAGRMVISGRMVDVCAELDRMASAEAAC